MKETWATIQKVVLWDFSHSITTFHFINFQPHGRSFEKLQDLTVVFFFFETTPEYPVGVSIFWLEIYLIKHL